MEVTVLTEQHKTAIKLNEEIILKAQLVDEHLYDMCVMLKQMRDEKLYKELGYDTFEDYCKNGVGFSRMHIHRLISISENVKNVTSMLHLGTTKLALLSSLSESQQEEIKQTVNLEETSVRELKAEIDRLKAANKNAENDLKTLKKGYDSIQQELKQEKVKSNAIEDDKKKLERKLDKANEKITELESRPVEVAVIEDKDSMARIKSLERTLSEADQDHVNAMENQRMKYQKKINELESQLEQAKNAEKVTVSDDKAIFKAYYTAAFNAFKSMTDFAINSAEKEFCMNKIKNLLNECERTLNNV